MNAQPLSPADIDKLPESKPTLVEKYGENERQFGELRVPEGKGPFPVAVVIHGGCWTKGFATVRNTSPIATALTAKGIATWNIEYRQMGEQGAGWPGTFLTITGVRHHFRVVDAGRFLDGRRRDGLPRHPQPAVRFPPRLDDPQLRAGVVVRVLPPGQPHPRRGRAGRGAGIHLAVVGRAAAAVRGGVAVARGGAACFHELSWPG